MTNPYRPLPLPMTKPLARIRGLAGSVASSQLQAFLLLALMAPMPAAGIVAAWTARYLRSLFVAASSRA